MKKICVILALVLALTCAPALAAEGDALLGREEDNYLYFNYCFAVGDTMYLASYEGMYSYKLGDAGLTEYSFEMPEDEDDGDDVNVLPFAEGGRLYALVLTSSYGDVTEFNGAALASLTLRDEEARLEKICDVDWEDMVEYYGEDSYATRPTGIVAVSGKAVVNYFDNMGEYVAAAIDLETGRFETIDELKGAMTVVGYREGTLLAELYSYEASDIARLVVYDPADGSVQPLADIRIEDYNPLQGLAYDAGSDTVYCVRGGEICPVDLEAGAVGEGVTSMPLEIYSGSAACVLEGGYYGFCSEGACVRNLDPGQMASIRLKINDGSWSDCVTNTYYSFSNTHGDVNVVLSRDYSETMNLIENMMNRDDSIDIYVLYTSTAAYDALYNRGYLMEMDGSANAGELAERMYPSMKECLCRDGHLVALPLTTYAWTMGVNENALEALGMTIEDVPDNWSDFLDFIAGLGDALAAGNNVHLFYSGYTADDAKYDLFNAVFEAYQTYVNTTDPHLGYNTKLLRGLVDKLEGIDFEALGCEPAGEDDEDGGMAGYAGYSDENVLLQTGAGCTIGNYYGETTPLLLRVDPDTPAKMVLDTAVAVINPFSKNPDVALAFIDELAANLPAATLYNIDPSLNEPVRGKWNEEYIAEAQQAMDDLNAELEAAEPADRQMIEDAIREAQQNLDYYDQAGWEISPREIEWYRAHDDEVITSKVNWLYADESGEAFELMSQYREGRISAAEMLTAIDRKVQMMLLEGN